MNRDLILSQLEKIEYNARRLRTLVETDLDTVPDNKVAIYCALQMKLNAEELERTYTSKEVKQINTSNNEHINEGKKDGHG